MKIAQIMLAKGFGGAERSFVDLCAALTACGHEVLAICEPRADARPLIEQLPGVSHATLRVFGPWDLFARYRLRRQLSLFGPAIVQCHLARAAFIGGAAASSLGLPTLAKTHNYVKTKYYRNITHLVPTTSSQYAYLRNEGIDEDRLTLIPNFSSINPQPRVARPGEGIHAVAIGRLVYKKGFDVLLRALHDVRKRGYPVTCSIVGDGSERRSLEALRNELGLSEHVSFIGWQKDVAGFLAEADVFVLPSRDEPFGIVCLEAMAIGVPIIATQTDGPREILDEGTALMIPVDNPAALADQLRHFVENRPAAERRAENARALFNDRYSEHAVVGQYLDLYEVLIKRSMRS